MKKLTTTTVSPKVASAIFFALYSVFFLLLTYFILLPIEKTKFLYLIPTVIIVLGLAIILGAVFGESLAKNRTKLALFFLGWLFALEIVIGLCLLSLIYHFYFDSLLGSQIHSWKDFIIYFGLMVLSVILIIGWLLFPLTGFAAIYFSKRFYPGLIKASKMQKR